MGFLAPKPPKIPPAPKPANPAIDPVDAQALIGEPGMFGSARSMISTGSRGLRRRATTQRTSLIGG